MRKNLKKKSYVVWRKRVRGRASKHRKKARSKLKYYDKDIYPIQFMPGTIHLSNTITDDYVYGYGIGLKGLNHKSIKIQC